MTRFLVTGGSGFIGSHVVDALVEGGHEVRIADTRPAGAQGTEDKPDSRLRSEVEHVWGDLADREVAADAVAGVDAVCHQAAMVGLGVDFADVASYVRHNDLATARLLEALHAARFAGRFVLASSMVVYGEGRYRCARHGVVRPGARDRARLRAGEWEHPCPHCGRVLEPQPVPEDAPADPGNVYAATKLHQEHLCRCFGREHGVAVTVLRYHNVYGPRMPRDTPYAGVASLFRRALEHGEAPRVFEDGRQLRDFIHVHDVARANVLALTASAPIDGPVNVASGVPRTVLDLARALASAFGPGAPQPCVVGGYRLGDVRHVFASADVAREKLGFVARVRFEQGIAQTVGMPVPAG